MIAMESLTMLGWLGWTALDIPMMLALPLLIVGSAFFSGSETALFSLTASDRMEFRHRQTLSSRSVLALVSNQRMLLVTILLGNMTMNVLYFVISSVLMMRTDAGTIVELVLLLCSLVIILLFGEVLPKMLASTHRHRAATLAAPPLFALHSAIGPLRIAIDRLVIGPLARLTAPPARPPRLTRSELDALLDVSSEQGIIDDEEQRILGEVFNFRRLKVRDIMQPRVRMRALPIDFNRAAVIDTIRQSRLTRLPVYEDNLDHIVGMLHVKRYLLEKHDATVVHTRAMSPAMFVPQMATLEQLLELFRSQKVKSAIVIDEFGGTAGIVTMTDIAEELVGEITGDIGPDAVAPQMIGEGCWRVSGQFPIHDWIDTFGHDQIPRRIATLGGLITERLGRPPELGDMVDLGNIHIEVESIDGHRVSGAIVSITSQAEIDGPAGHHRKGEA